jgi:hypothetical protein
LKRAIVVYSEEEAAALNLDIDHDIVVLMVATRAFAILTGHSKGSRAAKSLSALKLLGKGGYSKS